MNVRDLYDKELLDAVDCERLLAVFLKVSLEEAREILEATHDEWAEE